MVSFFASVFPACAEVLPELLALYRQLCGFMSSSMHDKNQSIIENVRKYLGEHYTDPSLCLDSGAEHLGVSYYFLSRIFTAEGNQSFSDMLNDTGIYRAMGLLHSTDLPVQSISEQAGYTNWSTFLRAFKKRTDLTPLQYRKNHAEFAFFQRHKHQEALSLDCEKGFAGSKD